MSDQSLERQGALIISDREPTALEVIAAAARDPSVDVQKLKELLAMKERLDARDAEMQFNRAMSQLQAKVPRIVRLRSIMVKGTLRSKYAGLEDIDAVVRPLMIEQGLSASYTTDELPGGKETRITCIIRHVAGHKQSYAVTMPFDRSEYRTDAQCQGSTISYGKRYALCNALNIVTVGADNDGAGSYLDETQRDSIRDMLAECGAAKDSSIESGFLKYMAVKAVSEILARDFRKAIEVLEAKRRKQGR